jgi:hypothetical protein
MPTPNEPRVGAPTARNLRGEYGNATGEQLMRHACIGSIGSGMTTSSK